MLTKNLDNIVGTSGNDTISGSVIGGGGGESTLSVGDSIVGGTGTDTLMVSLSGQRVNNADTQISSTTLNGVEKVNVTSFETDNGTGVKAVFDASLWSGVESVGLIASSAQGDVDFINLANVVKAEMANGTGDLTLAYSAAVDLTGASDAQSLTLNNVSGAAIFSAGSGFEVFNIATTGAKSTLGTLAVGTPSSGTQTINVTGDKDLTITNALANTVKTVNASAFTGALNVTLDATVDTSVTGGSGNDVFNYTTGLTNADTIDGGEGTDILSVTESINTTLSNISNIEVLRMGGSGKTYDVSKVAGVTGYQIYEAGGGSPTSIAVTNLANDATVSVLEDTTTATTLALATADSTLNLVLDNGLDKSGNGVDVAAATLTNVKTLNVESKGGNLTDNTLANANSVAWGTTSALTTVNVTGDTNLSLGTLNATVTTVDANAFTGRLFATLGAAGTVDGGTGADSITGSAGNDVIRGGAGNDTISGGGGDDNIDGGAGNDSITVAAASAATKVVTVTGGEGNDTITLTSGTGYFNLDGGTGDDRVVVSGGTSIYFDANDTILGGEGTDSLVFAGTTGASFDLATGSTALQNVSGFEAVELNVAGLANNNETLAFTFNDVLASSIGNGTLNIAVKDAAVPAAHAGADVTIDASGVLLTSTRVNVDTSGAAVQYVYHVGGATENVVLGAQDDTVRLATAGHLTANDTIDAGAGSDTLALNYGATSSTAVTINTSAWANVKGFETINLDGVTGVGTGALVFNITDAFAVANHAAATNTLTVARTQLGSATIDDTGTTKIDGSAVTATKLVLSGASGADTIIGGGADDIITGNGGNDVLTGGGGNDVFVATASMGVDTITDFNFGTGTTSVDKINVVARGLTFNGGFDTVVTDATAYNVDEDVVIITSRSFVELADVDTFYETRADTVDATGADKLILWQDSMGKVHLSQAVGAAGVNAAADGGDEWALTDLFILDGVTVTGIASLVNTGDFIVA